MRNLHLRVRHQNHLQINVQFQFLVHLKQLLLLLHRVKKGQCQIYVLNSRYFSIFFRAAKDVPPIEILPDEPEPFSFAGQLLITGISLTCRLITVEIQQTNLYRFIQLPSLTNLSMPLPIIPILQSGPIYPGKQSIIRYFMLIPTPKMIHNEEVNNRNASLFHESL